MYFFVILLITMTYSCDNVFIAPNGDQSSDGCSQDNPTTFTKAYNDRRALGGKILFLPGRYESFDDVVIEGSSFNVDSPLTFEPANANGDVIIDGSRAIEDLSGSVWSGADGVYTMTDVNTDIWQLFQGETMLMNARWPDVTKHFFDQWDIAFTGRNPEPNTAWDVSTAWANCMVDSIEDGEATIVIPSLPSTIGNLEGATVHLEKCGSARTVISHDGTSITVSDADCVSSSGLVYLENHINLLDQNREWFYNDGTLTVKLSEDPSGKLRGRVIDRALKFSNFQKQTVLVKNLKFFAALVTGSKLTRFTFEDCTFQYPSFPKSMLGDFSEPKFMDFGWDPSFINCKIQYYWNIGLKIWSRSGYTGATIENNLIEYGGAYLSGALGYAMKLRRFGKAIVRRNTIQYHARGGGIEGSSFSDDYANLYELNLIQHISVIHWEDVGCIHLQIRQQKRTFIVRNWFLHSGIIGARFDAPQATIPIDELGFHGTVIYNVGRDLWQGLMIKGSYHITAGNTMSSVGSRNALTIVDKVGTTLVNVDSSTYNNIGRFISGARTGAYPALPGYHGGNAQGYDIDVDLRDPAGYDFRLREESPLKSSGTLCTDMFTDVIQENDPCYRVFGEGPYTEFSHVTNVDWSFLRDGTPNVGAYQKDTHYWIPGRQLEKATFPIPAHDSEGVSIQVDLMFRQGRNAVSSEIYLGTSEDTMEMKIALDGTENIYSPTLLGDTTYFWRVDTVLEDGSISSSDVWQFKTEIGVVTPTQPAPEPYTCVYGCDGTELKTCKNKFRIRSACYGGQKCDFQTCQQYCDEEDECEFFFSTANFKNNLLGGCHLYRSCEQLRDTHSSGETMQKLSSN